MSSVPSPQKADERSELLELDWRRPPGPTVQKDIYPSRPSLKPEPPDMIDDLVDLGPDFPEEDSVNGDRKEEE